MTRTVYIAGPMTGLPDFNYPAFNNAAALWRAWGWEVINPAEFFAGDQKRPYHNYIRVGVGHLLRADSIAMLPGWHESRGATMEHTIASMIDLQILDALTGNPLKPESILEEAARLTGGSRNASYGNPADDYAANTAAFNAITRRTGERAISPAEGALFMCCVKLAREGHVHKRDNLVDLAGYAWVTEECRQKEAQS